MTQSVLKHGHAAADIKVTYESREEVCQTQFSDCLPVDIPSPCHSCTHSSHRCLSSAQENSTVSGKEEDGGRQLFLRTCLRCAWVRGEETRPALRRWRGPHQHCCQTVLLHLLHRVKEQGRQPLDDNEDTHMMMESSKGITRGREATNAWHTH